MEAHYFTPVFKNKGPRPQVEALDFPSPAQFEETFLSAHLDKCAVILLHHPEASDITELR